MSRNFFDRKTADFSRNQRFCAISGQNRFFRPHSPIPQGGGVRGDSLRVPPAGFQSTSPQAGHFQTIDCYGGKNIILKNKSQILKE